MLSKCVNPACLVTFRYLHEGRLFQVAVEPANSTKGNTQEYFWLCGECSRKMTVISNGIGIQVVPLQEPFGSSNNQIAAGLSDPPISHSSLSTPLTSAGGTYVSTCMHPRSEKSH
jgi:hypothetical protein